MPKAIVIGAGFGGIASALRLRAKGYDVTILDKQDKLGGRAYQYERHTPQGTFIHDAGPTVITAKFLFDELFELFGKKREDYVTFADLHPWYRIRFADGTHFNYGGTLAQMESELERVEPGSTPAFHRYLAHSKKIFDTGFTKLGAVPFHDPRMMFKATPDLIRLQNYLTVWQLAAKYFKTEKLRRIFSFQPLLVGGNPFNTTSIYALIFYLEREWGIQFALGGTGAIVQGLERLMREEGIEIRLETEVERLDIAENTFKTASSKETPSAVPSALRYAVPEGRSLANLAPRVISEVALRLSVDAIRNIAFLVVLLSSAVAVAIPLAMLIPGFPPSVPEFAASAALALLAVIAFGLCRLLDIVEEAADVSPLTHAPLAAVRGVTLMTGDHLDADLVVCNGDAPHVYANLLHPKYARGLAPRRVHSERLPLKYSMGLFVLYFGTTKLYPNVAHHTIVLGETYKDLITKIFDAHDLETKDLSVYLHRPTATDPTMAPPGCESFYVLVPVPNNEPARRKAPHVHAGLREGRPDWSTLGPQLRDATIAYLSKTELPDLERHITDPFYVTPDHFEKNLNTLHGTGFSIQPIFSQSAYFRFHNKAPGIDGLYFVGAATHPGAGIPGVLCSAKVVDSMIPSVKAP